MGCCASWERHGVWKARETTVRTHNEQENTTGRVPVVEDAEILPGVFVDDIMILLALLVSGMAVDRVRRTSGPGSDVDDEPRSMP